MYGDQFGEFVCGYWGLKGLLSYHLRYNRNHSVDIVVKVEGDLRVKKNSLSLRSVRPLYL